MEIKKLISRTDYLLPEKLEGLHAQSSQWLETIAFWKDETRFFFQRIARPSGRGNFRGFNFTPT